MKRALGYLSKCNDEFPHIRECLAIPALFESDAQIETQRKCIADVLERAIQLNEWPFRADKQYGSTPFFLSYHAQNNNHLMRLFYDVLSKKLVKVPKLKPRPKRKR